ncbi:hypothetical protein GCM10010532_098310 [Dactylosporangium siamense]|uniref:Uncharacterized protein n=2 Tax=Dactylosporangium siamense TaxID=685454 RepID=A0A919UIP1_9ACTN|nr:hypothetical protein Dsi01nite_109260 [Dactylosporangium siamense]
MSISPLVAPSASTTVIDILTRLRDLAVGHGDRIAVIDAHRTLTYAELWQAVHAAGTGQRLGDRIVVPVAARPTAATVVAAFGVWLSGGIPMPVPANTRMTLLEPLLQQTDEIGHWCQPWRAHLHTGPGGRQITVTGGQPPTSSPVAAALGLTIGGTALLCAPLYAAAVFDTAVRQLLLGGTVVLRHEFNPRDWLDTIVETRADWAVLAAGQVMALIQQQDNLTGRLNIATGTLRRIVLPAAVPAINVGYLAALTAHTGAAVTTWYHAPVYDGALSTPGAVPARLTPLPGVLLRTVDPAGRPTPPGVAGLIEASSSSGATAHSADQPCTPAAQWRTSGDIGTIDGDGRLTLHRLDRARLYRASAGPADTAKVRVAALQQTLNAHPDVASHTVHVVPDAGGEPRAHVRVRASTASLTPAALARHCAALGTPCPAEHITITSSGEL